MPSDTLPGLLSDLGEAAEAGDRDRVRSVVGSIRDEIEAVRPDEKALLARAVLARDVVGLDGDAHDRVNDLAKLLGAIDIARTGTVTTAALYGAGLDDSTADGVVETAAELEESERELLALSEAARPDLAGVDVPAAVAVVGTDAPTDPQPKGGEFDLAATVANVGDDDATGVTVGVDGPLPVDPATVEVGTLAGGDRATPTVEVAAETAGEFEFEVSVDSADAGDDDATVTVEVLDRADAIAAAVESLDFAVETVADLALPRGIARSLSKKLDNAGKKLDQAERAAGRGQGKRASNLLNAATNLLGAALNELAGLEGSGRDLPDGVDLLERSIEGVIDDVALAREADP